MKWLTLFLCLLAMPALAETHTQEGNGKVFFTRMPCDDVITMTELVNNQYGEELLFLGQLMTFEARTGAPVNGMMMFFTNQDTGTFSIVKVFADGTACMVGPGIQFMPYGGTDFKELWEDKKGKL